MPATNIALKEATRATALTIATGTAADTVNNNTWNNDGSTVLICKNTGASPYTVSVQPTATVDGQTAATKSITVTAGDQVAFGPFPTQFYGTAPVVTCQNVAITIVPLHVTRG